jgi:ribonuclease E
VVDARDEVFADLDARDEEQPLVPPELDVDPLAGIDTFDDELDAEGGDEDSEAASRPSDEESGERRGRRRRRRRRGRGRKESPEAAESDSEGESGDNVAGGWGSATSQSEDRSADSDTLGSDDEGDEEFAGISDKNSHRAIPTWDEAIGYIVTVNMESRAKNPGRSGAPRGGRGRRGRNGSRGGGNRSN